MEMQEVGVNWSCTNVFKFLFQCAITQNMTLCMMSSHSFYKGTLFFTVRTTDSAASDISFGRQMH